MFTQVNHPISIGIILFIQIFLIAFLIGWISQSFWFSYILFLVFIGGLLILFLYTISLIFNNKFNFKKKNLLILLNYILFIITITFLYQSLDIFLINNNDIINLDIIKSLNLENSINLNKLFNYPNYIINLIIVRYLFFILVVVVKVTNFFKGPIRVKN